MSTEEREEFKEMELWEHLDELRGRLIRSLIYIIVGLVAAWYVYPQLENLMFAPLMPYLEAAKKAGNQLGGTLVYQSFTEGFMLRLQVSLVAGLIIAIPLVTLELWGFIAPGLTRAERKACYLVFPASLFFFFSGVACGYALMGVAVGYFMQFISTDKFALLQNPVKYLVFLVKMIVAFGVCFQLPIILMFLAWVELVNSKLLKEQWRLAVVGCFAVAAIATPGGDPMTMLVMAAPLAVLYMASIYMVALVERVKQRNEKKLNEALSAG